MADPEKESSDKKKSLKFEEETPVERSHETSFGGKSFKYTTKTGRLPLKDDQGEIEAQLFYVYYRKDGVKNLAQRPILFAYNGGPGSPSIWLHLGALGPKRIPMKDGGFQPEPPYALEQNDGSWLEEADIVFIDPVGTGYSQAKDEETAEKHWGMSGDIANITEFIRIFLTREKRTSSPLYLSGESYGTTRSAGIAHALVQKGFAPSGVILVSNVLAFLTLRFTFGNDLPFVLYLPTYAAAAWHHGKVKITDYTSFEAFLAEVEAFASGPYSTALAKGDQISDAESRRISAKLRQYTGLSASFLRENRNRIYIMRFCKELLRDQDITVGRLDSRITGRDLDLGGDILEHDPSMTALMAPYQMAFNHYCREELGYESDLEYLIFRGIKKDWKWDMPNVGPPDVSEELAKAMVKNPYMRVMVASGYFDLATPYFASKYTFSHMNLPPEAQDRITWPNFLAGHMMYTDEVCLADLKKEISAFIR